jgi:hypothetical protein
LNAVLESPLFARAPSLRSFLSYICEQYFEGKAEELKEYNIAVEALGRSPSFDHTQDSIVRVEAHKLRKRLKGFYEDEGADHPIEIEVPAGSYAPAFVQRQRGAKAVGSLVRTRRNSSPAPADGRLTQVDAASRAGALDLPVTPRPLRRRILLYGISAGAAVAALFAGLHLADQPASESDAAAASLGAWEAVYRLSAGSAVTPYVDELGMTWQDDRFFEGGEAVQNPSTLIHGTWSQSVFQTRREGASFSYAIPLDPGSYEVHLHFVETTYGPDTGTGESSRIFHVDANGQRILSDFDVLSDAGRPNTATTKSFAGLGPGPDGLLRLQFQALTSTAILNGIEVFKGLPDQALPIRVLAGDRKSALIDKAGQSWGPDRYFAGGVSVPRLNPISGTPHPSLYSAERYGNFRYVVPVAAADGAYTVRLHFAETWWGPSNPGGGGEGSRLFNVLCNGTMLLESFDVYKEAGGENRALIKTFRDIRPNPQSRIELSFIPRVNYASLNAIEIFQE